MSTCSSACGIFLFFRLQSQRCTKNPAIAKFGYFYGELNDSNGRWYNDIRAWRVVRGTAAPAAPAPAAMPSATIPSPQEVPNQTAEMSPIDEMPF